MTRHTGAAQAGHDVEAQKRYVSPVDPLRAREYRACIPDLERLGSCLLRRRIARKSRGRPALGKKSGSVTDAGTSGPRLGPGCPGPPQPVREDGKIRWNKMTSKFLEGLH